MTIDRKSELLRSTSTSFQDLLDVYFDEESKLSNEQIILFVQHPNMDDLDLIRNIWEDDDTDCTVLAAIARLDKQFLGYYLVRDIAEALIANSKHWSKDEWETIMHAFRENIAKYPMHPYRRLLTFNFAETIVEDDDDISDEEINEMLLEESDDDVVRGDYTYDDGFSTCYDDEEDNDWDDDCTYD